MLRALLVRGAGRSAHDHFRGRLRAAAPFDQFCACLRHRRLGSAADGMGALALIPRSATFLTAQLSARSMEREMT
jgi:hypothetical protein